MMYVRSWLSLVAIVVVFASHDINAGSRKIVPNPGYTIAELNQYWAGAVAEVSTRFCGFYNEGKTLINMVIHYEPAAYAKRRWSAGDRYAGNCAELEPYLQYFTAMFSPDNLHSASNQSETSAADTAVTEHRKLQEIRHLMNAGLVAED